MKFIRDNILLSTILGLVAYIGLVFVIINLAGCDLPKYQEPPPPTHEECVGNCNMECFLGELPVCDCEGFCR